MTFPALPSLELVLPLAQTPRQSEFIWSRLLQPGIAIPVAGMLVGVIAIVAGALVRHFRIQTEARLKRAMIDRGISADEIERVLIATG